MFNLDQDPKKAEKQVDELTQAVMEMIEWGMNREISEEALTFYQQRHTEMLKEIHNLNSENTRLTKENDRLRTMNKGYGGRNTEPPSLQASEQFRNRCEMLTGYFKRQQYARNCMDFYHPGKWDKYTMDLKQDTEENPNGEEDPTMHQWIEVIQQVALNEFLAFRKSGKDNIKTFVQQWFVPIVNFYKATHYDEEWTEQRKIDCLYNRLNDELIKEINHLSDEDGNSWKDDPTFTNYVEWLSKIERNMIRRKNQEATSSKQQTVCEACGDESHTKTGCWMKPTYYGSPFWLRPDEIKEILEYEEDQDMKPSTSYQPPEDPWIDQDEDKYDPDYTTETVNDLEEDILMYDDEEDQNQDQLAERDMEWNSIKKLIVMLRYTDHQ